MQLVQNSMTMPIVKGLILDKCATLAQISTRDITLLSSRLFLSYLNDVKKQNVADGANPQKI